MRISGLFSTASSLACCLIMAAQPAAAAPAKGPRAGSGDPVERIIIFRHGEKPQPIGYGQLDCAGLNRSLRLPQKLAALYPQPYKLYAPDPHYQMPDGPPPPPPTPSFYYVRPLATIEPLAIQLRMPVDVQFHYDDVQGLMNDMLASDYHDKTLYVAWEHGQINNLVAALKQRFDSNVYVPVMQNNQYDYIFAFSIDWSAANPVLSFALGHEGISPASACPYPAVWIWNAGRPGSGKAGAGHGTRSLTPRPRDR
jgi:hypothetical protein